MQIVRFPFTVIELEPTTRPPKGDSRKVRGPRKGKS
jgi:hypothetical protein